MQLGSGVAVVVVQASSHSSDWILRLEISVCLGYGSKDKKNPPKNPTKKPKLSLKDYEGTLRVDLKRGGHGVRPH